MALPAGREWELPEAYKAHVRRAARNPDKPIWASSMKTITPTPSQEERAESKASGDSLSHMTATRKRDHRDAGLPPARLEHSAEGNARKRTRTGEEAPSTKKRNKSSREAVWLRLRVRPEHEVDEDGFLLELMVRIRIKTGDTPKQVNRPTSKEEVEVNTSLDGHKKRKAKATISANDENQMFPALTHHKPSVPLERCPSRMGKSLSQERRSTKRSGQNSVSADAGRSCRGAKQRSSAAVKGMDSRQERTLCGKRPKPASPDGDDAGTTRSSCSGNKKRKNVPKLRKVTHEINADEWENLIVLKDANREKAWM